MARSEMPCASLPGPIRRPSRGACATAAIAATPVRSRDAARRCVGRQEIDFTLLRAKMGWGLTPHKMRVIAFESP